MTKPRVFVAYSRDDAEVTSEIVRELRDAGVDVYWDKDLSSEVWAKGLKDQIVERDHFLWVMSPASVKSPEVVREHTIAHDRHATCHVLQLGGVDPRDALAEVREVNWIPRDRISKLIGELLKTRPVAPASEPVPPPTAVGPVGLPRKLRLMIAGTLALSGAALVLAVTAAIRTPDPVDSAAIARSAADELRSDERFRAGLRGAKGDRGPQGNDGVVNEQELARSVIQTLKADGDFRAELRGEPGAKGDRGPQGNDGVVDEQELARTVIQELKTNADFLAELRGKPVDEKAVIAGVVRSLRADAKLKAELRGPPGADGKPGRSVSPSVLVEQILRDRRTALRFRQAFGHDHELKRLNSDLRALVVGAGRPLRIVAGSATPTWREGKGGPSSGKISFGKHNLEKVLHVFTSLTSSGMGGHGVVTGAAAPYNVSSAGFEVFLYAPIKGVGKKAADANSSKWTVNWLAVGY